MSIEGHLNRLTKEHKDLDEQIKHVVSHHGFDSIALHELKKQKLLLKDRIDILRRSDTQIHRISGEQH